MVLDTVKFRRRAADWLSWITLAAAAVLPRAAAMLTVERRLDADESIVGLMAKHIAHGEGVPFFFYGQNYGGGHVIEALFAAPFFKLHGVTEWAVTLAPVLFSLATILMVFFYLKRRYGAGSAFVGAVFLSLSTQYLKSSLKADGYIETIFLCFAALALLDPFERSKIEKKMVKHTLIATLIGALLGLAFWSYDFALIYIVAVFAISLRKGMFSITRTLAFAGGAAVGVAPLVAANIATHGAHIAHLVSGGPAGAPSPLLIPERLISLAIRDIPAFLTPDCVHNFIFPAPWYAWVSYACALAGAVVLFGNRKKTPGAFALIPAITVLAYVSSGYAGRSPRYLLPLEPFLSLTAPLAFCFLLGAKRHISNLAAGVLIAILLVSNVAGLSALFGDNSIVEGNVKTNPESLVKITAFLEKNDVRCIYTTYFIKWRILLLTDEKINAVDINARDRETAYLRYENLGCPEDQPPAYVFHKASRYRYMLTAELNQGRRDYKFFDTSSHVAVILGAAPLIPAQPAAPPCPPAAPGAANPPPDKNIPDKNRLPSVPQNPSGGILKCEPVR